MAAVAPITVNDRESTPVAHVFTPYMEAEPNGFTLREAAAVLAGDKKITITTRKSGNRTVTRLLLVQPTLVTETINGVSVYSVARTAIIDCEFRFEDSSSQQERKNAVGMFYNALATSQTMVLASVVDGEAVY